MNIKGLKVFSAIIETGSFSGAALKLNCVQPNITAHINKLETQFGVRLLIRSSGGITLTAEGVKLKKYAYKILHLMQAATDELSIDDLTSCSLDIGILQTINQHNLIDCINHHNKITKQSVSVKTMSLDRVKSELIAGNIDCGLMNEELVHPSIYNTPLWKENAVICYNDRLFPPIALQKNTSKSAPINLISYPKGCYYRAIGESLLKSHDIKYTVIDFDNLENIFQAVHHGLGYAILPESYVRRMSRDHISFQEIYDSDSSVQIWFSCQNRYLYNFKELNLLHDILVKNSMTQ
jgi:DNA-binding transcriptional LysR family regulator